MRNQSRQNLPSLFRNVRCCAAASSLWVLGAVLSLALSGCISEGGYVIGGPGPSPSPDPRGSAPPPSPSWPSPEPSPEAEPWSGMSELPLTATGALGQGDAAREASLRLVITGLEDDEGGRPTRALASYQRAVRLDSTNPFAYLALARHHLEYGSPEEAGAFLDQARAGFEAEGRLGPAVDVWGLGLRGWVDRSLGRDDVADRRFRQAQELAPDIWADELLSAGELR